MSSHQAWKGPAIYETVKRVLLLVDTSSDCDWSWLTGSSSRLFSLACDFETSNSPQPPFEGVPYFLRLFPVYLIRSTHQIAELEDSDSTILIYNNMILEMLLMWQFEALCVVYKLCLLPSFRLSGFSTTSSHPCSRCCQNATTVNRRF